MAQVANILLALDQVPKIDRAVHVSKYPGKLSGKVPPYLDVTLRKASVYDVFMMVEFPADDLDMFPSIEHQQTIGMFYNHILQCIKESNSRAL